MKKILFIVPGSYIAGTEKVMLSVMRGLRDKGYPVICIVSGWNDGKFVKELEKIGIHYQVVKLGFLYWRKPLWTLDTLFHYPKACVHFLWLKRKFKPDIVYHCSYRSIFMLYPFLGNVKNVLHVHDYPDFNFVSRLFFRSMGTKVSQYIAVSDSIKKALISRAVPEQLIVRIYNGIPLPQNGLWPITSLKENYNYPINLGIVGQVLPRKGHHLLIEALSSLDVKKRNMFHLKIFGTGNQTYIQQLKNQISSNGLDGMVEWMGFVQNQQTLYEETDIVVVPTITQEPFGLVAIEPAIYGKLVMVSNCGGLAEIVQDQISGIVFQSGNVENLKSKLIWICDYPQRIVPLAQKAQEILLNNFSESLMLDNLNKLLDRL